MMIAAPVATVDPLAAEDKTLSHKSSHSLLSSQTSSDLSPSCSSSSNSQTSSTSQTSSRDQSPSKNNRPATPPTPTSISACSTFDSEIAERNIQTTQKQTKHSQSHITTNQHSAYSHIHSQSFSSNQDSFLQLIEPFPVLPPNYDTLPPGGCPRFPISHYHNSKNDVLPSYSPSVYKIGIVSRKVEWLTPYEPAPSRSWKHVIMELNSTQINFYNVPSTLENHLLAYRPTAQSNERTQKEFEVEELKNLNSNHTSDSDLQFFKMCQRLNLIGYTEGEKKNKRLSRSYSLQHCKIGLATDYKKRPNVLRMRIESEQVLLNFPSTKDLIDWNMAIGIGKDIALDLNERELPRYRTVPRRRRRNRTGDDNAGDSEQSLVAQAQALSLAQSKQSQQASRTFRLRSQSDPNSKFRDKLSKLKSKLSVTSATPSNSASSSSASTRSTESMPIRVSTPSSANSARFPNLEVVRSNSVPNFSLFTESEYEDESALNSTYEDEDDDYDEEYGTVSRNRAASSPNSTTLDPRQSKPKSSISANQTAASTSGSFANVVVRNNSSSLQIDYEDEEDIQNMSDLHQTDEEDEEEEEVFDDVLESSAVTEASQASFPSKARRSLSRSEKWSPPLDKVPSKRKYYRNCLRCIKPLTMDDTWVSRSLVKPTTLSPLNFAYLKNVKYNGELLPSSSTTSLISLSSSMSSESIGFRKNRSFSFKDINGFNLPDSALTKVPNHFLKEYVVGSHGLIPKEV
ncbi:uncharacterized protein RJT20DRAFT_27640 [Scheffersomyces xylosifermentans]|uniref:uncharacterized protein n=1 Tax=Scheffersomyces xylosifermentans TaxID=1304137 RepID=UPI00315CE42F